MATTLLSLDCRLANASLAAYAVTAEGLSSSAPGYSEIGIAAGTNPVCFLAGTENIDAGFLAETTDNWVLLAFRGTIPSYKDGFWSWLDDWLQDFEIGPVPWTVNNSAYGNVEGGFAAAVLALWPAISTALASVSNLGQKKGIVITGHSKGAAMSYLVASLVKARYPMVPVLVRCFAAPMTCDRDFQSNYNAAGLGALTVRYQNEDDLVPFLPYVPVLDLLAAGERRTRADARNRVVTSAHRAMFIQDDYVALGQLRYITTTCIIETGPQAETDAWDAIVEALLLLEFDTIADAHSLVGRYLTCTCGCTTPA